MSRGVLLDVARHEGVDRLPGRFPATRAVLEAVEAAQGTPVEEGDIVLVRTGQVSYFLAGDVPSYRRPVPALDYDARCTSTSAGLPRWPSTTCRWS